MKNKSKERKRRSKKRSKKFGKPSKLGKRKFGDLIKNDGYISLKNYPTYSKIIDADNLIIKNKGIWAPKRPLPY